MFSTVAPLFEGSQDHPVLMLRFVQLYEPLTVEVSPSYFEHEELSLEPLVIDHPSPYYASSS